MIGLEPAALRPASGSIISRAVARRGSRVRRELVAGVPQIMEVEPGW
jgi:hypothetical protein